MASRAASTFRSRVLPMFMGVVVNLITVVGILEWGWPPANIFLLFLIENLVIGVTTIIRMADEDKAIALIFGGIFTVFFVLHTVLTAILLWDANLEFTMAMFGLPLILLLIRHLVEFISFWTRDHQHDGRRVAPSPHPFALRRLAVLQFASIIGLLARDDTGDVAGILNTLAARVPSLDLDQETTLVLLLLVAKTAVELLGALRTRRPAKGRQRVKN